MLSILTIFSVQTHFFSGLNSSSTVAVGKIIRLKEYWFKNLSLFPLNRNLDGTQMPDLFVMWTHLDFGTHVSPKQLKSFLPSKSQS